MRLGKFIPPWVQERLGALGMKPSDIDHYVFHQPSEIMVRKILSDIGVDPDKGVYTHSLYGNTASASVGVTYQPAARGAEGEASATSWCWAAPRRAFRWSWRPASGPGTRPETHFLSRLGGQDFRPDRVRST